MRISDLSKPRFLITWDNPLNDDQDALRAALGELGSIKNCPPKTTVVLKGKARKISDKDLCKALKDNLDPKTGAAVFVRLGEDKGWQIGPETDGQWQQF